MITAVALALALSGCKPSDRQKKDKMTHPKGTFAYDAEFMQKHQPTVTLARGDARVLIAPGYQGRIMTSSAGGESGKSFGWINYELIESGKTVAHFNNYGGEERLWLGPEGGQFSLYFAPGVSFEFENWQVPAPIDTEPFDLVSADDTLAKFVKSAALTNYSGFQFVMKINRSIYLLDNQAIQTKTGVSMPNGIKSVAYETVNKITNTGKLNWNKETGLISVWILGQLISSPSNVVLVPYLSGPESELGPVVNDNYFGKVPSERLKVREGLILFKADGLQRGKIGLSPQRAKDYLGSYDFEEKCLTLVFFNKPSVHPGYVNSMWELQKDPYSGDAVNSYNDGPLEDGSQLGPFYELETSSPAAELTPGASLTHSSITLHVTGDEALLEEILMNLFGISASEIKKAF